MRCYRLSVRTIKGTNGKTMSQDNVSALDIARSLPGVLRRLPSITRGLYYYSLKNEKRELTLGTLIENNARSFGNRPAILFEDRTITWGELNSWAESNRTLSAGTGTHQRRCHCGIP